MSVRFEKQGSLARLHLESAAPSLAQGAEQADLIIVMGSVVVSHIKVPGRSDTVYVMVTTTTCEAMTLHEHVDRLHAVQGFEHMPQVPRAREIALARFKQEDESLTARRLVCVAVLGWSQSLAGLSSLDLRDKLDGYDVIAFPENGGENTIVEPLYEGGEPLKASTRLISTLRQLDERDPPRLRLMPLPPKANGLDVIASLEGSWRYRSQVVKMMTFKIEGPIVAVAKSSCSRVRHTVDAHGRPVVKITCKAGDAEQVDLCVDRAEETDLKVTAEGQCVFTVDWTLLPEMDEYMKLAKQLEIALAVAPPSTERRSMILSLLTDEAPPSKANNPEVLRAVSGLSPLLSTN